MGEIYVARQPIFNSRMKLFGYELLYRDSEKNQFSGMSDDQATAAVITDSFFLGFDELIDGTRGFINFSQNLLLSGTALLLPSDKLVIEIVERTEITPVFVAACRRLKKLGYKLALDNFIDDEAYRPLVGLADMIKVDYHRTPPAVQALMIRKYKPAVFVAMKIETAEEFKHACNLGYGLFQGYFFNKPVMVSAKEIGSLGSSMVQITQRLSQPEPNFKDIAAIIEKDMELSYKLLRIANSAYYRSTMAPINSIQQGIAQIGLIELRRWAHLLLVKGLTNAQNAELIKTSLVRGKMMSLYAEATGRKKEESEYFFTGLFSSIDTLLDEPMDKVLARLPLTEVVTRALMGGPGPLRTALDTIRAFEMADWEAMESHLALSGLPKGTLTPLYIRAVRWQQTLIV